MKVPAHPLLIVDDLESNRDLLARRLTSAGYPVAVAESGAQALHYLSTHEVSIVLLDVQMPGMSGLEVLEGIRKRWSDAVLPVLMVTAKDRSDEVVAALDLGANDYITKPIDFQVALARIRAQLSRKDAEDRLRASEERYALAARGTNDGLWDWDLTSGRLYYSTRWKAIIGHDEDEVGDGPDEWFGRVHSEDLPRLHREVEEHLQGNSDHFESQHRIRHKSGAFRWVLTRALAVRDAAGQPVRMAGSESDVTEGKVLDALTGLPNRVLLVDRIERMLNRGERAGAGRLALLFIDLDGFKPVNDGLGHLFGDQLLRAVAQRLKHTLQGTEAAHHTVARLGGDEFVVLLHEVRAPDEATQVADRIQRALAAPFELDGHEVFVGASIGIAFEGATCDSAAAILRDADTAMYRAKALGGGRSEVFDAAMRQQVVERMELDTALRLAVKRHEFVPFFQPIVDLRSGRLSGFEALLRWQRPGHGIVPPAEFVGLLQDTGLIVPAGRRFFGDVCQLVRQWQVDHPVTSDLSINVNFAGAQFTDAGLLDQLLEMVDEAGLHPRQLVVEVTESTAISDFDHAVELMGRMRQAGFRIVLDDFGTGYSSLSCLHKLPITGLKLNSQFIGLAPAIPRAIIALAEELGLTVTAEGIESEPQRAQLQALGCGFGQGFLFGGPADANAAETLIARHSSCGPRRVA